MKVGLSEKGEGHGGTFNHSYQLWNILVQALKGKIVQICLQA